MIDHVTIRVRDLGRAWAFYGRALELLDAPQPTEGFGFDWGDFSLTEAGDGERITQRLHIAFYASENRVVDDWWHAMTELGYRSDGEPGPRPAYGPEYYGAFVLDDAGNSVEAVNDGAPRQEILDHLWIRVRDLEEATRFYEAVCPTVDHAVERYDGRTQVRGDGATFSLLEGEPTVNLHLAFAAGSRAMVAAFHEAGTAAGYASNGAPGERPEYHPGYYGAFLLDPDGQNVEAVFHER
jgi:catechol 2,3-dioxygenase-like lactoylglutathione lyase family enzyme